MSYLLVCVCVFYNLKDLLEFFPRGPNGRFSMEFWKGKEFVAAWMVFLTGSENLAWLSGPQEPSRRPDRTGPDRLLQNLTTEQRSFFVERQRWVHVFRSPLRLKEKNEIRISGGQQIEPHHTQQKTHTCTHMGNRCISAAMCQPV